MYETAYVAKVKPHSNESW